MGWEVEKTLLYSDPGLVDYAIGTSADHHDFPLNAASPPSAPIDRGGTDDYVKGDLDTINVAPYDYWGLSIVSIVTQVGVSSGNWAASQGAIYAQGIVVGSNSEQDADLNNPLPALAGSDPLGTPHSLNLCSYFVPQTDVGLDELCDGHDPIWSHFGFFSTGSTNMSLDSMNLFVWVGLANGSSVGGTTNAVPRVSMYDQLKMNLHWQPTYAGAISTQPRIKMKIYGVGVREY